MKYIYFKIILLTTIIKTRRINVGIIDNMKNKPLKHPLPQVSPSYNIINATAKGNKDSIIKNTPKVIFLSKSLSIFTVSILNNNGIECITTTIIVGIIAFHLNTIKLKVIETTNTLIIYFHK